MKVKRIRAFGIASTLLWVGSAHQVLGSLPLQEQCPSEVIESTGRLSVEGVGLQVTGPGSLLVRLEDQSHLIVDLGGVDASKLSRRSRDAAVDFIKSATLDKKVTLTLEVSPWIRVPRPQRMLGVVAYSETTVQDLALNLLQNGMIRYKEPKAYSISRYRDCTYRLAEESARRQKRGIWR
jgi:Staphylococcal nuclease homologue